MNIQTDHRFGDRLACARVNAGCSRRDLADRLSGRMGQEATYLEIDLKRLEDRRGSNVSVVMVAAIAKALNCSLLYLLGVEDG